MADPPSKPDLSGLRIDRSKAAGAPPRTGRKAFVTVLVVVAVVAAGGLAVVQLSRSLGPALQVKTATATVRMPSATEAVLTASGYVVAQRAAAVASKATGRLVYLGVEEGDRVTEGQELARVESEDMEAALEYARAEVESARAAKAQSLARVAEASAALRRAKSLSAESLISSADFDQASASAQVAEAEVKAADAHITAAEAAVRSAEVALDSTRIRAPFDGTVLTKSADLGEMVAPMASAPGSRGAVVTIADMGSIEVEADVSESYIQRIQVEAPVEIVLDAYPDTKYPGHVKKIVPTADRAKATVLTKVVFDQRDARVLPEMSAKVTFLARSKEVADKPELTVPKGAVVTEAGQTVVWKLDGQKVRRQPVTLGSARGAAQVVASGLTTGDVVVVDPPPGLADGTTVQPAS